MVPPLCTSHSASLHYVAAECRANSTRNPMLSEMTIPRPVGWRMPKAYGIHQRAFTPVSKSNFWLGPLKVIFQHDTPYWQHAKRTHQRKDVATFRKFTSRLTKAPCGRHNSPCAKYWASLPCSVKLRKHRGARRVGLGAPRCAFGRVDSGECGSLVCESKAATSSEKPVLLLLLFTRDAT